MRAASVKLKILSAPAQIESGRSTLLDETPWQPLERSGTTAYQEVKEDGSVAIVDGNLHILLMFSSSKAISAETQLAVAELGERSVSVFQSASGE